MQDIGRDQVKRTLMPSQPSSVPSFRYRQKSAKQSAADQHFRESLHQRQQAMLRHVWDQFVETSCPFRPGEAGKGSKARALPWTRQGATLLGTSLAVFAASGLNPSPGLCGRPER
jgi:hypothetical protein